MKTGELYIEQVLIGALVATIMLLPWLPELRNAVKLTDTAALVTAGSIAVAVAFWIGIPFDRFADTLSGRLDQHNRLRFALSRSQHVIPADGKFRDELFPEDKLRVRVLREGEGALAWVDYHRSRIRLTRALAFYGPGLTLSLALGLLRINDPKVIPLTAVSVCLFAIVVGYALWALLASLGEEIPRTNEEAVVAYARRWQAIDSATSRFKKAESHDTAIWLYEGRALWVPVAMLVVALWAAIKSHNAEVLLASLGAIGITALSAWAWWRISVTYRTYLDDLTRFAKS